MSTTPAVAAQEASRPTPPRFRAAAGFLGTAVGVAALVAILVSAVALVAVPRVTGSVPLTVLTGSMTPTYPPGTVVVVRPTPVTQLRVGDVATYQVRSGDPTVVTHRIVGITVTQQGRRLFTFRGDANSADDPAPVRPVQIRGRVWYSVPLVGYLAGVLSPTTRQLGIHLLAAALLAYGAWLMVSAAVEHRRRAARTQ